MAENSSNNNKLLERYEACMVLHATGDSMGFKNNLWESNRSTEAIQNECKELGDVESIICEPVNFPVSDDTILHLAISECLIENYENKIETEPQIYLNLIKHFKRALSVEDQRKRSFGQTTVDSIEKELDETKEDSWHLPFNPKGFGCGASIRSSCIGLRYSKESDLDNLIKFSIESSRMTHHNPLGYLGGFCAALFTSYALQNKKLESWGASMMSVLPKAQQYIKDSGYYVKENLEVWPQFEHVWNDFLKLRQIQDGNSEAVFPSEYGVKERDSFYRTYALSNRNGSSGHDSVLVAYDSLLACKGDWKELCYRAVLHGGDNDSTGCIATSWYGALYGFKGVPERNYKNCEYKERLLKCAQKLYKASSNS